MCVGGSAQPVTTRPLGLTAASVKAGEQVVIIWHHSRASHSTIADGVVELENSGAIVRLTDGIDGTHRY